MRPPGPGPGPPIGGCSGGGELFLRILQPHEESDVVVVCRANPVGPPRPSPEVEFYCHSEVLRRSCSVFADAAEFELLSRGPSFPTSAPSKGPPPERRRRRFELFFDDDIVFEVLRYAYCGAVYFHLGFRARFSQFLSVVDFLGIEDMADRRRLALAQPGSLATRPFTPPGPSGPTSLFEEPGVEQWLRNLQREDVLSFLQDEGIAAALAHGVGAVGFSVLCNFLAKLIELRPSDLTVDVLGESLYRRLADFGSGGPPSPSTGGPTAACGQPAGLLANGCATGSRASHSAPPSANGRCAALARPRLLHLPGPVVYVDLASGRVKCVNVVGLEPVLNASLASAAGEGMGTPVGLSTWADTMGDARPSSLRPAGLGRLFHDGRVAEADATRESLLQDCAPPHREVVVFYERAEGQQLFDATWRRAQERPAGERARLAVALDGLVAEAALQRPDLADGERCAAAALVRVRYNDHHEMSADLALYRDADRDGPCLTLAGVRPGGRAELAGAGAGWTLRDAPQDLLIDAPLPGALGVSTAVWESLHGLWLELRAPAHESVSAHFPARPFGFSWAQEASGIVIREVKPGGRAVGHQVHRGMVITSMAFGDERPITRVVDLMEALRGDRAPATVSFGWRQSRKCITAHILAGVQLEERALAPGWSGGGAAAALGAAGAASSSAGGAAAAAAVEGGGADLTAVPLGSRAVVVAQVPPGHPAAREGLGPGWQVLTLHPNMVPEVLITSLEQLPARLVNPSVELSFVPPPPLYGQLPLDRSREDEDVPPEEWLHAAGGAVAAALPWQELSRCDVGPLCRIRVTAPACPSGGDSDVAMAPAGSSSSSAAAFASWLSPRGGISDSSGSGAAAASSGGFPWRCRGCPPGGRGPAQPSGGAAAAGSSREAAAPSWSPSCASSSRALAPPASSPLPPLPLQRSRSGRRVFEVLVLGQLPPASRAAEQRIRGAGPHDALAWEVRQALEAVAAQGGMPASRYYRLVVVAIRLCHDGGSGAPLPSGAALSAERGWLGGLLLGESVAQVLFRIAAADTDPPGGWSGPPRSRGGGAPQDADDADRESSWSDEGEVAMRLDASEEDTTEGAPPGRPQPHADAGAGAGVPADRRWGRECASASAPRSSSH